MRNFEKQMEKGGVVFWIMVTLTGFTLYAGMFVLMALGEIIR